MKCRALAVLWIVLICCQCAAASDTGSTDKPKQDYWLGIYYDQSKIGSLHVTVRKGRVNSKDGWIRDEALRIRFRIASVSYIYAVDRELFADNNYNPVSDDFTSDYKDSAYDGYCSTHIEVSFQGGNFKTKTSANGEIDEKTVPISEEGQAEFTSGCKYDLAGKMLSSGAKFAIDHFCHGISVDTVDNNGYHYDPSTISVLRRETITVGGVAYNTLVVFETSENNVGIKRWQLDDGEIIKEVRPAEHLVFLRETKGNATEVDEGQGPLLVPAKLGRAAKADLLSSAPANADYWLGVYYGSSKLGYFHVVIRPDKFEGKAVFRRDAGLHLWRDTSGKNCNLDASDTKYVGKGFFPLFEASNIVDRSQSPSSSDEGGVQTQIKYTHQSADLKATIDGKSSTATDPLTDYLREWLITGCTYDFGVRKLNTGDLITARHCTWECDGEGMQLCDINGGGMLDVLRREKLELDGQTYDVLVVSETCINGDQIISWRLDNGEVVKQVSSGLTMVLESKEKATQPEDKKVKPKSGGKK